MEFSKRTHWTSSPNLLSGKLADLKKEGRTILDLTVTNPTACGFQYLNTSLLEPFLKTQNLSYEPDPRGLIETRRAISAYYEKKGILLDPRQIFITASTSEAYNFVFRLLFEPGQMLMAPRPSYPLLDYLAQLNDIQLEPYPLVYEKKWAMNLEKLYGPTDLEPKAILLVNPNNPTGNFIHHPELAEIRLLSKTLNMAVISDEVFFDFALDSAASDRASAASNNHSLTFTLSGISKTLGLPQMKLSWIVVTGPEAARNQALERLEIIADTYLSAGTPVQHALPGWLTFRGKIQAEILTRLTANYNFLLASFSSLGAVRVLNTEGGWSGILKLPSTLTDEEWSLAFLEKDGVQTHPGYLFDFEEGSFIVLSLLVPQEIFREGVQRIAHRLSESLKRL